MLIILLIYGFLAVTLPPTAPVALPLVVLKTQISVTENTQIDNSITVVTPKSVGYSQWLGEWQSFNAILSTTTASAPTTGTCTSFPCAAVANGFIIGGQ